MSGEAPKRPLSAGRRFRAALHIIFGIVYLAFAGIVIYFRKFGTFTLDPTLSYGLGALLALYGLFRIWRGIKDLQYDPDREF